MNINHIEDVKGYYEEFKKLYESGENEKAAEMMKELLENLENNINVRKAGSVSKNDVIAIGGDKDSQKDIYISLNHVMEYYIYAYYFCPLSFHLKRLHQTRLKAPCKKRPPSAQGWKSSPT